MMATMTRWIAFSASTRAFSLSEFSRAFLNAASSATMAEVYEGLRPALRNRRHGDPPAHA